MAKATLTEPPKFVARLKKALQKNLPGAEISATQIRGTRYRFEVISDEFTDVGHPERQRRVWDIAAKVVPGQEILDVGMILTIAPEELPQD